VAGATVVRASGLVRTTTQTDERGRFVIEAGWNETVYPPSIVKDDLFLPATEWWTRVNNGGLERAAQHPIVLRPKSTVTLRVTDPDGQPIEGAIVNGSPWMRTPPPSDPLGISAVTDRSGRCLFRMMLVGSAFVWASKPGYVSGSVACVGGSRWTTLNASVVLTPLDGRVRGVVVDHEDRSVAGAWVMPSVPCPESATLKLNTVTDSAGRFTLPSTPRGPFVVSAGRRQGMLVLRGAGVASGGDEHVKLVLHPNTPYGGWVPQPVAGVPTATRPEEHPPGDPDAAIAEMIAELKKPGPGPSVYIWDLNVRVPELAESVRPIADRAVKALRALLQERPAEGFQPQYVLQLLDELDTPAARALLLDVALGVLPEKPIRDVRLVAAHRYALHSPDRDGLLRLLDVNDPSLIETALWQLGRWPIDEALFNRLSQLVHRQPPSERGLTEVFGLLGYDSDPRLLERKIDLAISVIDPTTTRPDAPAEPLPRHELYWRVHHPKNALIVMSGAGASLKARTAQLKGMARDVVLAARAERGDELVHDEIIEMLRDLRSPIRQYLAIRALPTIARRSDLAVINAVEDEIRSPQAAKELPENLGFWDLGQYIRRAAYMIDVRTPLDE